jgi:hypothetical protein
MINRHSQRHQRACCLRHLLHGTAARTCGRPPVTSFGIHNILEACKKMKVEQKNNSVRLQAQGDPGAVRSIPPDAEFHFISGWGFSRVGGRDETRRSRRGWLLQCRTPGGHIFHTFSARVSARIIPDTLCARAQNMQAQCKSINAAWSTACGEIVLVVCQGATKNLSARDSSGEKMPTNSAPQLTYLELCRGMKSIVGQPERGTFGNLATWPKIHIRNDQVANRSILAMWVVRF